MERSLLFIRVAGTAGALLAAQVALAVPYTNISGAVVDFPAGDISFADAVVQFAPGIVGGEDPGPLPPFLEPANTLGVPDVDVSSGQACFFNPSVFNCKFASLGVGGQLTVEFIDNFLTGSGDTNDDLYIFEIGPDIEDTFVEISANGLDWVDVGKVSGSTKGVDIDAFGFGPSDLFRFVRLTDDPAEGNLGGETVGADIDAIGAISTVIPVPAAAWLFVSGLGVLGALRRRG